MTFRNQQVAVLHITIGKQLNLHYVCACFLNYILDVKVKSSIASLFLCFKYSNTIFRWDILFTIKTATSRGYVCIYGEYLTR